MMKKIKLSPKKIILSFYLFIIILSVSSLLYNALFLYKNFYQIITRAEEIEILQETIMIEAVDMEKFNSIIEKINEKTSRRELDKISNPFD
ncbi:MAG: hypothetical protein V1825_01235 [Candidatus Falkowbacteria bacterium]|nr:hypothetical protein [Candidatus Parcubacteria bacterium]